MNDILADIGYSTTVPFSVIVARLVVAAIFGAIVGFEREWRDRPAGLRTHTLICLASALIAILTIEIMHSPHFADENARYDPIRLIEAVTAGVAFLVAGLIIVSQGKVQGLTTGAGMWLSAAIGLAAGLGFWQIAAVATLLALIILSLMAMLERKLEDPDRGEEHGGR